VEKDLARFIALTAFRSSADLGDLVPFMKEYCDNEDEYRDFALAVAGAAAEINRRVLQKIFNLHPDLETDFEAKIKKFRCVF
jgi:hypothetical protein